MNSQSTCKKLATSEEDRNATQDTREAYACEAHNMIAEHPRGGVGSGKPIAAPTHMTHMGPQSVMGLGMRY